MTFPFLTRNTLLTIRISLSKRNPIPRMTAKLLMKWVYDKETKTKRRVCFCDNPCTTSSCGRMIYIYPEKNLRAHPDIARGSKEWDSTCKIRVNVEKSINYIKDSFCIANRRTQNEKTLHADLLLAGITQLVTVMIADKIHQHRYLRSLKPLIA